MEGVGADMREMVVGNRMECTYFVGDGKRKRKRG
jgi:hypothetical protein